MPIKLKDGTVLPTHSWKRIKRLVNEHVKTANPAVEINSGGVTINIANLTPKKNLKFKAIEKYINAIEGTYKDWTIRIWREQDVFCANFWQDESNAIYREFDVANLDENDIFIKIKKIIGV